MLHSPAITFSQSSLPSQSITPQVMYAESNLSSLPQLQLPGFNQESFDRLVSLQNTQISIRQFDNLMLQSIPPSQSIVPQVMYAESTEQSIELSPSKFTIISK
jgi:hypothetical protein